MTPFQQLERPSFFTGQLVGADDFQREQDYFRGKARLHNRFLHGWGIVSGLDVGLDGVSTVVVAPGLALDCAGNELVLAEPVQLSLAELSGRHYVTLRYLEIPLAPVPSPQGEPEYARVRETVRVELAGDNPAAGHAGMGPGSAGCGQVHALCLATLTQRRTQWRVAAAKRSFLRRR
jgi:hypothetical protein